MCLLGSGGKWAGMYVWASVSPLSSGPKKGKVEDAFGSGGGVGNAG